MPTEVTYVTNNIGFHKAFRSWGGPVGRHLQKSTVAVRVVATATAPKKTGELAAGHEVDYGHHQRDLESRIVAVPDQAKFIIKGTSPHIIRPRKPGGRLVFFWKRKGRVVSLPSVSHPGIKANNYLGKALQRVMKRMS